ncbi:MAG: protein-glutamate O-methyltransferase CheR [Planctomycetes bacterium]|nr:protein-glutamate O-methyltransferase CheR [Planctomycetota bacterium]
MERDLSREEFQRYHDLIYKIAGIHYPAEKLELLSNRIKKRLRATGTPTYDSYLARLQQPTEAAETQAFLDSITTNETYFFRCQRHWDFFRQAVEQRQADPARRKEPLRLWSAAASTGAEAFTMLIVLQQALGAAFASTPIEVLGTDLSTQVLEEAKRGAYRAYALAQTAPELVKKYFTKNDKDEFVFDRTLARLVTFQRHNLMEPLPGNRRFDFVFLRNVMIYFDGPSRERVLKNAFDVLLPGGHLVVGESESLLSVKHGFQYVKPSVFVKPTGAPAAPKPSRT